MSSAAESGGGDHGAEAAPAPLRVLTFEVGPHLLAVPADQVDRIDATGTAPAEGVSVVDAVGLLLDSGAQAERRCTVVLRAPGAGSARLAVTATRAGEVRTIDAARLLPLPSYLFRGESPFKGLAPATAGEGRTLFLLAGPDRLRAAAEAL